MKKFKGGMGKGMGNMSGLMKQAQKMQTDMTKAQEEIAEIELETSSGGRMVTVRVNGVMELLSINIDPEAVDPEDTETLEDLIIVAVNSALAQVKAESDRKLSAVTGGMGGLPGMPF